MSIKKIVFFCILIASLFTINNLVHSIYTLWQKEHLIEKAKNEIEKEKKENQALKQKLSVVRKPQFVEEEARDRLFLAKPGEGVLLLPTVHASPSAAPPPQDTRPNWKKWWDTFFGALPQFSKDTFT